MNDIIYILDASAFINGYEPTGNLNYTVSDISYEIKVLEVQLRFNQAIDENRLSIRNPSTEYVEDLEHIIKKSGDSLRLSQPDKMLLALALELQREYGNIKVLTDDYSIQNVLKILNIPFESIITEGIKQVYNWIKTCNGCRKDYPEDYPYDDCEICGSSLFNRRIKK